MSLESKIIRKFKLSEVREIRRKGRPPLAIAAFEDGDEQRPGYSL